MTLQPTRAGSIVIAGHSFEGPYSDTSQLRNTAGVYVVVDVRAGGDWSALDVGESLAVRARIENHDREDCWRRNVRGRIGVVVKYTPGWTDDQRRQLERRVRQATRPPCGNH